MGIWQKLTGIFRPTYRISFDMTDAMTLIQGQTETELYKTQPHLRTVISFLADNVAQVGLKEFRRVSDTDRQRITDSPLINLLKQPNPDMTGFELLRQLTADLALHDVAYWIVTKSPERNEERFGGWQIRPIPPSWVTAKQDGNVFAPGSYRVDSGLGQGWTDVPAENMLVFHGWNPNDPTTGVTPVMALKDIINEQIQAWSYRTQTWQRGGRVGTVLVRPKDAPQWDDTARERFARDWKTAWNSNGSDSTHARRNSARSRNSRCRPSPASTTSAPSWSASSTTRTSATPRNSAKCCIRRPSGRRCA